MITGQEYIGLLADLLNADPRVRERERRVLKANRLLYKEVVAHDATDAEADLALARAAVLELSKPINI